MEIRYFVRRLEEYQNEIAMMKKKFRKLCLENVREFLWYGIKLKKVARKILLFFILFSKIKRQ